MIPLLLPQHISLKLQNPRVPQMRWWVELVSRHASLSSMSFTHVFFQWLHVHLIMVEDCPYVGMDYHGDLELMLPEGEKWSRIDKIRSFWLFFIFLFLQKKKLVFFMDLRLTIYFTCRHWTHFTSGFILSSVWWRPTIDTGWSTGWFRSTTGVTIS